MNPQVQKVEDTINQTTSLEKVHLFMLYNSITVHRAKKSIKCLCCLVCLTFLNVWPLGP